MTTLLLRLAGPMQAWGSQSRFATRATELWPSKSGVVGMLAAALGRARRESVADLAELPMAVRIEMPGTVLSDFHTAHNRDKAMPLTQRFYLHDAMFLVGIAAGDDLLHELNEALVRPRFPLALGRRSCPPAFPWNLGLREAPLATAITSEEWHASEWFQRECSFGAGYKARVVADAGVLELDDSAEEFEVRDNPVSFDPARRQYGLRKVESMLITLMDGRVNPFDPWSFGMED
ncbi:MAG: type I-E CRISPR-associated protein Cas5/CasD [Bowdeniella nasicola]|nr:type I-E CRISPR-associated protein Cas5/CasD [Bowdeniella nasicola]